jgi:hypothetical protein
MGGAHRGHEETAPFLLQDWELIHDLPVDDAVSVELQPLMDRVLLLASAANRARRINELFGTHITPAELDRMYASEDVDILTRLGETKGLALGLSCDHAPASVASRAADSGGGFFV